MIKLFFSLFLATYLAMVFGCTMKNFSSISWPDYFIVVLPSVIIVIMAFADTALGPDAGWLIRLPSYLLVSCALILNAPSSFDRPGRFIVCSSVAFLLSLAWLFSGMLGFPPLSESAAVPLGIPFLILVQNLINRQSNGTIASFDMSLLLNLAAAVILCIIDAGNDEFIWCLPLLSLSLSALLIYLSRKKYLGMFRCCSKSKCRTQQVERPAGMTAENIRMD